MIPHTSILELRRKLWKLRDLETFILHPPSPIAIRVLEHFLDYYIPAGSRHWRGPTKIKKLNNYRRMLFLICDTGVAERVVTGPAERSDRVSCSGRRTIRSRTRGPRTLRNGRNRMRRMESSVWALGNFDDDRARTLQTEKHIIVRNRIHFLFKNKRRCSLRVTVLLSRREAKHAARLRLDATAQAAIRVLTAKHRKRTHRILAFLERSLTLLFFNAGAMYKRVTQNVFFIF